MEVKYDYYLHEIPILLNLSEEEHMELLKLNAKGAEEGITQKEIDRLRYLYEKGIKL